MPVFPCPWPRCNRQFPSRRAYGRHKWNCPHQPPHTSRFLGNDSTADTEDAPAALPLPLQVAYASPMQQSSSSSEQDDDDLLSNECSNDMIVMSTPDTNYDPPSDDDLLHHGDHTITTDSDSATRSSAGRSVCSSHSSRTKFNDEWLGINDISMDRSDIDDATPEAEDPHGNTGNAEPAHTSNLPKSRLTEMAEERARRIRDHHGVALSHADMASASLLSLLRKANSPLDLYDKITGWSKEWVNSDETLPSRADFMKRQGERYNLDGLYPKNIPVFLAGRKETVNVVVHDFASCLFSLLSNPALMQKEYLLFDPDNPSGWCGPEEPKDITHDDDQSSKDNDEDGSHLDSSESSEENDNDTDGQEQETNTDYQESVSGASNPDDKSKPDDSDKNSESDQSESSPWIGDINTSAMFRKGLETYCPLSDDFLCPLIFFIDGTPIDVHGNLSMEPVQMTLGIFNQAARARPEFWVTIGYVNNPNTKRSSYEVGFEAAKARLNLKERGKKINQVGFRF